MAEIRSEVLDSLAAAHQQGFSAIQTAAEAAATSAWMQNPDVDDEDGWSARFWLIVFGAATASSSQTREYLQQQLDYLGLAARLPEPDLSWVRDDFDAWAVSPLVRARILLSEGAAFTDAAQDAATRVSKLTSAISRTAEQTTLDQMFDSPAFEYSWEFVDERPPGVFNIRSLDEVGTLVDRVSADGYRVTQRYGSPKRWIRVTQGGACGWCRVVADSVYSDRAKDRGSQWHTFCRCTWRLAAPSEANEFTPQHRGDWRSVIHERADTGAETSGLTGNQQEIA